ncbi:hypothetical protein BT96DRAFT_972170 [Gymnopus androsaceus JB14]|uniref:Uncharacterized protein n=1 Tax=Gymnopus androsaceus JB14 TaxID=1447944 RepID=A0A6A4IB28_9AGAR|nr:hypothetical protein BT96DRAFT_972170 [Gymnopus androsaceus JB14]
MAQYLQSRIEDPIWLEPHEISFLRTRIFEEEALIQTFESRMDKLRAQFSELTLQKRAKLAEIASLRDVLAPVRRVPLEILSEILKLSSYTVSEVFTLSSVCVAWRKAAHATPRLWSKLSITLQEQYLGSDFGWVEDWITRSQTVPLDLYMNFYLEEYDESQDVLTQRGKQLLEYILTQFGNRVRLLNVAGHPSSFLPILHLSPSSLLSLEKLSFEVYENGNDTIEDLVDLFPRKVEVFLGAPKLRQVELDRAFLLGLLALPAEQLTSLKVYAEDDNFDVDPTVFVGILPRCKQLVSLEITLPDDFTGFSMSLIMDAARFQQRSSTALMSLVFFLDSSVTDERLDLTEKVVAVLSLFPTIRSLKIHPPFDVNTFVQAMTCTEGHCVLPNLQDLVLERYLNYYDRANKEDCLSGFGFKSMVLSRWWPDDDDSVSFRNGLSRLQNVTLWGFRVDSVEDIKRISTLSGLVLDYRPLLRFLVVVADTLTGCAQASRRPSGPTLCLEFMYEDLNFLSLESVWNSVGERMIQPLQDFNGFGFFRSPNVTTESDLRIFSSDGNVTMQSLLSADTFSDTCAALLQRMMINTVPIRVTMLWVDQQGNSVCPSTGCSVRSSDTQEVFFTIVGTAQGLTASRYMFSATINSASSISKFLFEINNNDGSNPIQSSLIMVAQDS